MANPKGTNTSFEGFTDTPAYGSKKREGLLTKTAPVAGSAQTGVYLGTARRAADLAREQTPKPRAAPQPQQTGPLPEPQPTAQPNPTAEVWAQVAAEPGASDLVKFYAAQAAR